MDPLEDRVRHLLSDDSWRVDVDTDSALTKVHSGAARRRKRRNVGMAVAAVLVVAAGFGGVSVLSDVLRPSNDLTAVSGKDSREQLSSRQEDQGRDSAESGPVAPGTSPGPDATTFKADTKMALKGFVPASFSAAGPETFWVLGSLGSGKNATTDVAVTGDGGTTFAISGTIEAPLATGTNEQSGDSVSSLRFAVDRVNGWAYGGALWATHDGGGRWTEVSSVPGQVERLEVANGQAVALAKEGDTWSAWSAPADSDTWSELDVELTNPGDLAVIGKTIAITDVTASGDKTVVAVSNDSGKSFGLHDTTCSPELSAGTLSVTRDSLWLACPTGTAAAVKVSHDDGKTWEPVDVRGESLPNVTRLGARTSAQTLVALPGEVLLLDDNGSAKPITVQGLEQPTWAGFTNEQVGYVLDATGKLFRTVDGGQTWKPVSFG